MLVAAEEFGVFLPAYDLDFIGVLNKVYNAPNIYTEERRFGPARELEIHKPIMTILGGVQPAWMSSVFPEEAWGMGLTSRIIMVYAGSGEPSNPFNEGTERPVERVKLLEKLGKLSQLYGRLEWSDEASKRVIQWHMSGSPPAPTHSKLEHYCRRRTLHLIKLSMISSVSRTTRVGMIDLIDVERGLEWLLEVEKSMPDAFRSMMGRSDHQVIEELYNHLVALYNIARQEPIHESRLYTFLQQRIPSDKIWRIMDVAERSGYISRVAGTENYLPKPRPEFAE